MAFARPWAARSWLPRVSSGVTRTLSAPVLEERVAVRLAVPPHRDLPLQTGLADGSARRRDTLQAIERVADEQVKAHRRRDGVSGKAEPERASAAPERDRLSGPHGHAVKEDLETGALGLGGQKVEIARRHPAARDQHVLAAAGLGKEVAHGAVLVGDRGPRGRRPSRGRAQRQQHRPVGVPELARSGPLGGGHELVSRDGDRHARTPAHGQGLGARERREANPGRGEALSRREQDVAQLNALTAPADVLAGAGTGLGDDGPVLAADVLDGHDRLGALRDRRARHDADRLPRGECRRGPVASGHETGPLPERLAFREIVQANRVAIHRRRVEGRPVDVRADLAGEHATQALAQRHRLLRTRRTRPAKDRERLFDRSHGVILWSRSCC